MGKLQATGRRFRRILKRIVKSVGLLIGIAVVLAIVGATAVWGHFWGPRVGNPTSESCTSCHVMQPYADSLNAPTMLASGHATEGIGCIDCHDYGAEEQLRDTIAYLQNDYQEPFVRVRYPMEETCLGCHEHGSYEQIAWRTTDLGVSDAQASGHPANPHQPPHYNQLECNSCHRVHRESTLLCWECHSYDFQSPYFGVKPDAASESSSP